MQGYRPLLSIRKLFALLIAVAVMLAPAFTAGGAAMAANPEHAMQMSKNGHCHSQPSSDHEKSAPKSCCAATCIAVGIEPAVPVASLPLKPIVLNASLVPSRHVAFLGEIATPPPRLS